MKIYVPVVVLSTVDGFQVPVIGVGALVELVGNKTTVPLQIVAGSVKVGSVLIILLTTTIVSTDPLPHCEASVGVNV